MTLFVKLVFNVRRSDVIALGVRVECPIAVTADVLDEAGQPPDEFEMEDVDDQGLGDPEW